MLAHGGSVRLEPLIQQLFEELEMGPLSEKDVIQKNPLTFALELDEELTLSLKEEKGAFYMHSAVTTPSPEKEAEVYQRVMEANLFGIETRGARLGLEKEGKTITLSCDMPEKMDYTAFRDSVEDFVNVVHYWREEIATYSEGA